MGRYSFFILSFCYRSNYVYADSDSSDILLDSGSYVDNSSSVSTTDSTSVIVDSSSSIQQEETTSSSESSENIEEDIQGSIESDSNNTDLSNPFVYGNVSEDTQYSTEDMLRSSLITTFAAVNPGTVYAGPNNGWNITGYFASWRLDGTLNATMIANNIDMIVKQARNSFTAVNSRLNGLENGQSSINGRISSLDVKIVSTQGVVDSVKRSIANESSRISSLDQKIVGTQGAVDGVKSSIANESNRISLVDQKIVSTQGVLSTVQKALDSLRTDATNSDHSIRLALEEQIKRIDSVDKKIVGTQGVVSTLQTALDSLRKDATNSDHSLRLALADQTKRIDSVDVKLVDTQKIIDSVKGSVATNGNRIDSVDKKLVDTQKIIDGVKTSVSTNGSRIDSVDKKLVDTQKIIDTVKSSVVTNGNRIDSVDVKLVKTQEIINNVKQNQIISNQNIQNNSDEIASLKSSFPSWSDVGIIAAIVGLHDTWKSKDYNASVLPDDGDAVKLMKSVANKIGSSISNNVSLLRNVFGKDGTYWVEYDKRWNNFPLWLQGLLNNYFDNIYNMENKDSLLYRLVYFFIDEMTKTRDFIIEINDNLIIANDSLLLITNWLKMIFEKPDSAVNVTIPPFDFNRLQQMLDGLNFGNIVNEAGTNIWDFLSQLIKTLGEVIGTAITGLTDIAGKILDLLGDLINQIIKLIVPENLDFLDTGFGTVKSKIDIKFGSFLSLGNQVKEVVQPINQDFKQVVSIDIMGAKFNPDFTTIDWVVVRFRTVMALSIWMSVAIYIYRKITGNGDLINDN